MATPDTSSAFESSMSDLDSGSDDPVFASPNAPTRSLTSRLSEDIDFSKLSPTSQSVKFLIADEISNGYNASEIARKLGRTPSWVSERLNELRSELLLQAGKFLPLSEGEYDALRADIERHGVQAPIVIGEHIALVDGRHRCQIAKELGIEEIPAVFLTGMTAEQERELSYSLNTARRQLTGVQKISIARSELMHNRNRSNRIIASMAGIDQRTIAKLRQEIVEAEAYEPSEEEIDQAAVIREAENVLHTEHVSRVNHIAKAGTVPAENEKTAKVIPLVPHPRSEPRVDTLGRVKHYEQQKNEPPAPKILVVANCPHCEEEIIVSYQNGSYILG